MSAGLDIVWENLIHSEKRKFCVEFKILPDSDETYGRIKARLTREGTRMATAGEKLVGLFIAEYAPNPLFIGELTSFFTSNTVMTAFVTDFLELPIEYRPGVNPLRLGDLFFAFVAMGCQSDPADLKKVATLNLERLENSKRNFIAVIEWLLEDKKITDVTVEELRKTVQTRVEKSLEERRKRAEKTQESSISCEEYNFWHRNRHFPPLNHQHPVVRLRYMTRSGQERSIFACLCCAAVEPKDCICTSESAAVAEFKKRFGVGSSNANILAPGAEFEKLAPNSKIGSDFWNKTGSNNSNNGDDDEMMMKQEIAGVGSITARPPPSKSAFPSSSNENNTMTTVALQARYHVGVLEECRMTKTKALKVQNIAVWTCCGAEAAKVNTTPIGYEVIAETMNGCAMVTGK